MTDRSAAIPALAEAFREHGFEGASLAQLCEATGLGKGSLYHFFPGGKDEMAEVVAAIQGGIVLSRALNQPEIFMQVIERQRARLSSTERSRNFTLTSPT